MLDEHRILSRPSDKVVPNQAIAVVPNQTIVLKPVYRSVVHLVFVQGGPQTGLEIDEHQAGRFRVALLVIPPGRYYVELPPAFHHMFRRHGVELAFTDRSGIHWLRSSDGELREIEHAPADFYGLGLPVDWASPEEVGPHDG